MYGCLLSGAVMLKISKFFLILTGVLLLSIPAQARVCFLADSGDTSNCLTTAAFSSACPGYATCTIPSSSAKACTDGGENYYLPEDCCSNGSLYEDCNGPGEVCTGETCIGSASTGSYMGCEVGKCVCDEDWIACENQGQEGVGEACVSADGVKYYETCKCSSKYHECASSAKGEGATCEDEEGLKYERCVCPTSADGWVTSSNDCCCGVDASCTNINGSKVSSTVYRCKVCSIPDCICGYSYSGNCVNDCSDDYYDYKGSIPAHVVCAETFSGLKGVCGKTCSCDNGYWDFTAKCNSQKSTVCEELGYTDKSCRGRYVACPYDSSAKRCLDG